MASRFGVFYCDIARKLSRDAQRITESLIRGTQTLIIETAISNAIVIDIYIDIDIDIDIDKKRSALAGPFFVLYFQS